MSTISNQIDLSMTSVARSKELEVRAKCYLSPPEDINIDQISDAKDLCIRAAEGMFLRIRLNVRVSPRYLGQICWEVNNSISKAIGTSHRDWFQDFSGRLSISMPEDSQVYSNIDQLALVLKEACRNAFAKVLVEVVCLN